MPPATPSLTVFSTRLSYLNSSSWMHGPASSCSSCCDDGSSSAPLQRSRILRCSSRNLRSNASFSSSSRFNDCHHHPQSPTQVNVQEHAKHKQGCAVPR